MSTNNNIIDNSWVGDIETSIFSKVKAILNSKLKKKYPDLFITDDDEVPSNPKFPSVYIEFLQSRETGQDLEGKSINAIRMTIDVQVTSTKEQGMMVAKEVAYVVMDIFKNMNFDANLPFFDNTGDGTKRMIARYSRVIGHNDIVEYK